MSKFINKSLYLDYLDCPKNAWLKTHSNNLKALFKLSEYAKHLVKEGYFVEEHVQKLFPGGIKIEHGTNNASAAQLTQELVLKKAPVLFQATFIHDVFLARNDILVYDAETNKRSLYEVKSIGLYPEHECEDSKACDKCKSNKKKAPKITQIIEDVSFQAIILQENGIEPDEIFLACLNKDYILGDQIDIDKLIFFKDITNEVRGNKSKTEQRMQSAKQDLINSSEDQVCCPCIYKGRSSHCPTFKYSNPYILDYSIHDIYYIGSSKKNLKYLVDNGCFKIDDIPESVKLSDNQNKQVQTYKNGQANIDFNKIKDELNSLKFPLYFFDYETYKPAIPIYKGFNPHIQMPFQFSIHILHSPDKELDHFEYLHESDSDPSLGIIQHLKQHIGPNGSIIVWHQSFEKDRNTELAERHPEHKEFLENINNRMYDLEVIFKLKKDAYIHPDFKGSSSIKNVLPVICPELSYKDLAIQEGTAASLQWHKMIHGNLPEEQKQKIAKDLKRYCGLDTYAMYAIWKHLYIQCNFDQSKFAINEQVV
ncbi:MAG: DUF2779 domain-containing protein [Candidatus Dependentiae bacterium]